MRPRSLALTDRAASIKVHPDRNRGDETAAAKFHALYEAHELLKDPKRRAEYDAKFAAKRAAAERHAQLDARKRALVDDLAERERAFKRSRTEARDEQAELERLKAEGARMRREREEAEQQQRRDAARSAAKAKAVADPDVVQLGEMDTTVHLKWSKASRSRFVAGEDDLAPLRRILETHAGSLDSLRLLGKGRSAVAVFSTLSAAAKAVELPSRSLPECADLEAKWAAGAPPAALGSRAAPAKPAAAPPPLAQVVPDELATLNAMRARQREREALEAQIRAQDAEDEANAA